MQAVQTFMRTVPPCGRWTRIDCRFGSNRRGVRLFACETLLPNCGPLPQTSHRFAMIAVPPSIECVSAGRAQVLQSRVRYAKETKFIADGFTARQGAPSAKRTRSATACHCQH